MTRCSTLTLLAAIAASFVTAFATAQATRMPSPLVPTFSPREATVGTAVELDLVLLDEARAHPKVQFTGFPLGNGETVTLDLEPFDVLAPGAQLVAADGANQTPLAIPDVLLMRGTVLGEPGSRVFLALSPYGSQGFLQARGTTFVVADTELNAGTTFVYDIRDAATIPTLGPGDSPRCGGPILSPELAAPAPNTGSSAESFDDRSVCRTLRLAIETDWEYFNHPAFAGNRNAAAAYAVTLLGAVSEIYRTDINVSFNITFLRIWTTDSDPFVNTSTVDTRLYELRAAWMGVSQSAVPRQLVHLLSGHRDGSGGIAYLGALCSTNLGYAVSGYLNASFPYPLVNKNWGNWDVNVVAHELGHNFGAIHTHEMNPRIDGCGIGDCSVAWSGTIMSYCHTCSGGMSNIILTLGYRVIYERIVPYLNTLGTRCILDNASAGVFTAQPAGGLFRLNRPVTLSAATTAGTSMRYHWRRGVTWLSDDATYSGTTTPTLRINRLTNTELGEYTLFVSSACAGVSSSPALVRATCEADFNRDGLIDTTDFVAFVDAFNQFLSTDGDFNRDSVTDNADFLIFVAAYNRLVCP